MKGKYKKILSLLLALAMVVQLFASMGNVAQAETITSLSITGRFTGCDGASPVQIGFSVDGTFDGGADWPNGFLHSGNLELNGVPQNTDDWRFQATGTSTMNMVCQNYTPTTGDLITIPAGTQIRCNGLLYEFSNRFSVKYDGTTWNALDFADVYFAVTGRYTSSDGASPVQIGFSVDKTIEGGGDWPNGFLHSGNLELNGKPQSTEDWRFQATGTSTMNMVCQNYTPTAGDVITIPLGTQVRCNDILYEFTNEFSVAYNGTAWNEVKQPDVSFAITGRYTSSDGTSPAIQIGFSVDGTIEGGASWPSGTFTNNYATLNNTEKPNWTMQATATNAFNLVCWDYTPEKEDIIKIAAGTQFACNNKLYEVTNGFTIEYNGTTWVEYVAVTDITINGLNGSRTPAAGEVPEQIGFAIIGTLTDGGNWNNCLITEGSVLLNSVAQSEWKIQTTATNAFNLVCWSYTPATNDIITIPAGTRFTDQANGNIYEIANESVIRYDGIKWIADVEANVDLTLGELITSRCVRTEAGKGYVYQLYIKTDHFDAPAAWTGNDNNATIFLNGEAVSGAVTWDDVANGILFVQLDLTKETAVNSITLTEGTQYTINNILYEIAEDYTIYHKNGQFATSVLYDIAKTVDGETTTETVTGDYTLPEVSKDGYVTLGWEVDEKLYKVGTVLPAKAEGYTINAVNVEFSQIDGAQVRLTTKNETEKIGGIRFVCKLGSDSKSDYITQMGMLIMPTNYMTNGELAHANYVPTNEKGTTPGYREFTVDKADMTLSTYAQDEAANGTEYYYLKGSIVDLYDYNYTRSYSARSFLKVNYADGEAYIYADYSKDNNARRICDIAKKMIETYPTQYAPRYNKTYPIVYEYAKVADTMESFAFYGPQVVVTNGAYDVEATKAAMQAYANLGFKYFATEEAAGYHVDNTFGPSTLEDEQNIYDNPRLPEHNLKQTMQLAKECGLEVLVLDWSLNKLSACDIPLVETSTSSGQVLAMCLETTDGKYPELLGSAIDESLFDEENRTYTYDGNDARVLHYVKQFESYDDLKEWVAIKMSAYAQEDNFRGVRLDDEPGQEQFAAVALMTKVVKELYPNAYVQTSSLQNYHFEDGGSIFEAYDDGQTSWESYWNALLQAHAAHKDSAGKLYATEAGINFYPYALWWTGWITNRYEHAFRTNYLTTLQHLAETTKDNGIDLEFTIQSFAVDELYANVSKADLNLQTNLALAFGTKTMGYFRYTGKGQLETSQTDRYINQDIVSDTNLQNAILYANKNGNYLKAHMTFFEYEGSKVYGTSSYVTTDSLSQLSTLNKNIFNVSGAPVLVNEFYNEYTNQYGYYVVNLAQLNNENTNGTDIENPASATITLSQACLVYKDYTDYGNEEKNKVTTVTLSGGQGAFIVVEE